MYKFGFILALVTAVIFSCDRHAEPEEEHLHEETMPEQETTQLTIFSDSLEYFIEYGPAVTGHTVDFLVHITHLRNYRPVTSGRLILQTGSEKAVAEAPERPGIYHLSLSPAEGEVQELTCILQLEGRTDNVKVEMKHFSDHIHAEESSSAGEIVFLKEQAWKGNFMVQPVRYEPFSPVTRASGKILPVPGEKQHVPAPANGILTFHDKLLVQGARVESGQLLFIISDASLGADNFELKYRELKNNLDRSRSEYRRHESLFTSRVISERQFIETRTTYINDSVRFHNLASKASENGLLVRAPISGVIHEVNFSEGEFVEMGAQLVTISSEKQLLLRADLSMRHFSKAEEIVTANFRTAYSDRIYDLETVNGTLLAKGAFVEENDHFLPVYFLVENDGSLLEGAYVEFFLKAGQDRQAVTVPAGAVAEEQGLYYCYLQVAGESYTRRAVRTGENDGRNVEILSGLEPGDRVVTQGVMLLKAASMVAGDTGHGHAH
ncbi:MAG: efflux RND transporter periplasmic adaptor subunit [Bacteroidales bacterium]|nr:efflux RND transporter periplasmic adaptor subunit [Bacteroidales bacterium]